MLDFAIFAVTFLLALVAAVLYLYPVTAVGASGALAAAPASVFSRVPVALPTAGRRGRARGEGSRCLSGSAPLRLRAGAAPEPGTLRGRAGSAERRRRAAWAAPRPLRRREVQSAWLLGFSGPAPGACLPALGACLPAPRGLPPCSRSRPASVTVRARSTLGWLFGGNSAQPKSRFPVRLRGNWGTLHSLVLPRGFSQHFVQRLPLPSIFPAVTTETRSPQGPGRACTLQGRGGRRSRAVSVTVG